MKTEGSQTDYETPHQIHHQLRAINQFDKTIKKSEYNLNFTSTPLNNQYEFVGKRLDNIREIDMLYHQGKIHEEDILMSKVSGKRMNGER